jgi:glycosyltransferase involved in cell wall biosynthesis
MNVFFVGGIFREEKKNEIIQNSKKMPYFAADAHQKSIIEGLEHYTETLTIINAVHVASYPNGYKKPYINGNTWSHNNNSQDLDLGFINIFGLKHIWRSISLTINLYASIKKNEEELNTIVSYGLHFPFLIASFINRKIFKSNIKWCIIIPEIPKFYIGKHGKSAIYNFLKKIDWTLTHWILKKADFYELVTHNMARLLDIQNKPFIVAEAIIRKKEYKLGNDNRKNIGDELKTVLYTGTTDIEFGIENLLRAFRYIKKNNYRLLIFGSGSGDELIYKHSNEDNRIKHMGFRTREEIISYQKEATLLVNPRGSEGEFTKYSFPSKTLEYMLSGNPVLMYKLAGIPDEYNNFVRFFTGNHISEMANDIEEICEWSEKERFEFGSKAKRFVLEHKNEVIQGKRLYDLILNS